ncbi:MAG: Gamma-glutamylputrescine synthetase PuuA [Alphaproteobacteria bacterium MarineAlpha5_Bin11]|nr:glutamine synthetase [Pelagibacteraceae bacterium]PPR42736.1 MAG: Gamma-glutamylputrescine synthetase PuuA [Alphaproteobacteria bacterium MarineAlpha5_Bin11]PPR51332.1 MAG: Gamma-glutamylputrescine synthetase PuuA [Alphaproteobacteria bacterium MarineAlpha5_Bin10]|tara:strand:- start:12320 stop:13687 length:1368 start_codon:yes stop_codon:yes gene_type:complete
MKNEFENWLNEKSITEVECLVADLGGTARGKILPSKKFVEGLQDNSHRMPQSIFIQTISGQYANDVEGGLAHDIYNPTDTDVNIKPDFKTMRLVPWYDDPTAQVICDAYEMNGIPVENAPRHILKKILKLYEEKGLQPVVSPEVEFYLVKQNSDPDYPLEVPVGQSGRQETGRQSYGIDAVNEFDPLFEDVYNFCEQQNIDIDTMNHESGSAQMEINFQHGDPLELADQVFLFKRTLRQTALRHKLYATFMAKPMKGQPGSALHLHQSLIDINKKDNIFGSDGSEFSEIFMQYIAGLQKYTPLLMPIYAPHVNSYKRLFATYGSPKNINWGIANRSCGFRIPVSDKKNLRVENRLAGSDTNPYLVFAANLASGFLGIEKKLTPTSETKESLFNQESTSLPANVNEAILQFEENEDINNIFGEKFVKTLVAMRKVEYLAYMEVVSPWEREYLLLNV